jgi:uncharacterized protein YkwD
MISVRPSPTRIVLASLAASLLAGFAFLVPSASAAGCAGANKAPGQLSAGEMRSATHCLINAQRQRRGLGSLSSDRSLRKAAARHSNDMVRRDFFSHYSPGGSSIQTRIGGSGYLRGARSYLFGEVIGGGTARGGSPKSVVQAWMHSGPHRAAILNGSFKDLGVGVARGYPGKGSQGATFTVDFGRRS